jgi:hypothetical protein
LLNWPIRTGRFTVALSLALAAAWLGSGAVSGSNPSPPVLEPATVSGAIGPNSGLEGPVVVIVSNLAAAPGQAASSPTSISVPLRAPDIGVRFEAAAGQAPLANVVDRVAVGETGVSGAPAITSVGFEGLDNGDNVNLGGPIVSPPDPQIAVGPAHIVELMNVSGRVFDKTGVPVQTFSLTNFFGVPAGQTAFDPKVMYDALSGRWFASAVSYVDHNSGPDEARLNLAISQTSSPTGAWNLYSMGYTDIFPDYAAIGVTSDKLTVSANLYDIDGPPGPVSAGCFAGGFCGEQTIVIEKADVLSGAPSPGTFVFPARPDRFTVRPAQALTAVSDQYLTTFDLFSFDRLTVIRITGTPSLGNVTEASATNLTVLRQDRPALSITAGSADCVYEGNNVGPPSCIDSGDFRMLDAVWRNNSLWSSASDLCMLPADSVIRSCAHLMEVETAGTPSLVQDIMFGAPGEYYSWPAIRTDSSNNLYVSFTATHRGIFAGARVTGRLASDPPNTMTGSCLLRAGQVAHDSGRWGDYLGVAVDPSTPSTVWAIGEYAKAGSPLNSGTYIGSLSYTSGGVCPQKTPPPPKGALDFSLGVDTNGDTTDDCGTGVGQLTICSLAPGSTFTVNVYLNNLGGIPRYGGYDLYLAYAGIGSKENPDANVWPDCTYEAFAPVLAGRMAWGCVIDLLAGRGSTYTGIVGTTSFNCTHDGSVTMIHGAGGFTDLVQWPEPISYGESAGSTESLTIHCVTPVGGVSFDAALGGPSNRAAPPWVLYCALLGTVAVPLTLSAVSARWILLRRRRS